MDWNISNLGAIASLVGVPLAIISVIQAKKAAQKSAREAEKSKQASEIASLEIEKFRDDIRLLTQIIDFEKSIGLMNDIKAFIRNGTYQPVPERVSSLVDLLNKVRSPSMGLRFHQVAIIQESVTELRKIEEAIDRTDLSKGNPRDSESFNGKISHQIDQLQPILTDLKNKVGERK